MGIILYVIDPGSFFKDPELVPQGKIDRTWPDLRPVELRFDPD
jgi:hypothetical protein